MDMILTGLLVLIVVAALYGVVIYNQLVALRNHYKNGFSQIEVQLKRRYDLIPNLVETAKAYLAHEKTTLENVIAARNAASNGLARAAESPGAAGSMGDLMKAETALGGAMGQFNLVMEAYPDLKANQNMMQLSEEVTSTENKVTFARQAFNDMVMGYNTYRQSFPQNMLVGMFGHVKDAEMLEFEDHVEIQKAPKVAF